MERSEWPRFELPVRSERDYRDQSDRRRFRLHGKQGEILACSPRRGGVGSVCLKENPRARGIRGVLRVVGQFELSAGSERSSQYGVCGEEHRILRSRTRLDVHGIQGDSKWRATGFADSDGGRLVAEG